ncbi:OmpA family protein [Hahella sp. HN01]|uniref:OmpA family protein n=1 Tax=Hahella sp. HN01 TaxID=2847262 RepID=UPI001C1EDEAD|nr:OmpA family protein [Hahella sp. HN01]MBU6953968.1 OmpA family protein [Hahella sp. HN01]
MRRARLLILGAGLCALAGCQSWPEEGKGGAAEIRSGEVQRYHQISFKPDQDSLAKQAQLEKLELDALTLLGGDYCIPAQLKTLRQRLNRAFRELDAGLLPDAYNSLAILHKETKSANAQLAYLNEHTTCAIAGDHDGSDSTLNGFPMLVHFDVNQSELSEGYQGYLTRLSAYLLGDDSVSIELIGHTDQRGENDANQRLAQARAKAVAAFLAQQGVAQTRIQIRAEGEEQTLLQDADSHSHGFNRRVEIYLNRQQQRGAVSTPIPQRDWESHLQGRYL